ncbi:site-specific integrase [Aliiroseovarius crassostreae]|uniref:site-specific integrase n=1 Tax=Aliiroseovarius crassostreae TaxID=154981 RepID=UPI002209C1BA|nr:site-specific integrase [Aliiroseovarius crassostreae]UWP97868.1 site-specific integrase [Aliiroseovarius crassostreae]
MADASGTSDNIHISEPQTPARTDASPSEIICNSRLVARVQELISASLAENTKRAYRADLTHFLGSGGELPASPDSMALYLSRFAGELAVSTLTRRVATLGKVHKANGWENPCQTELVKSVMRGIQRTQGGKQHQAKPLCREDLFLVLDKMGETHRDIRDKALLLTGFAGGFRRSELVGLNWADLSEVREGMVITLRRSKVDQTGLGRKVGVPLGRTRHCPVRALLAWRDASVCEDGAIFRPVDWLDRVQDTRLSGEAVPIILRERMAAAGLDPTGFSGHSLRAGFATSAAKAGVASYKIRQQTGHKSDAMLGRYIRDGELFEGNAAGALL